MTPIEELIEGLPIIAELLLKHTGNVDMADAVRRAADTLSRLDCHRARRVQAGWGRVMDVLLVPLDELEIPVRAYNSLRKWGLATIGDVLALTKRYPILGIRAMPGVGKLTAAELAMVISREINRRLLGVPPPPLQS